MTISYPKTRLFVESQLQTAQELALTSKQTHYIRNVIRLNEGDHIRVFNGQQGEYKAEIVRLRKQGAELCVQEQLRPQPTPRVQPVLVFAPIKKQRLPLLIEKAVEMGAAALHPVITDYTDRLHWNEEKARHWITEATEQCERLDVPALHPPLPLADWLAAHEETAILFCAETGTASPFLEAATPARQHILIGPEGGFSSAEQAMLRERAEIYPVSLGSRILRAETAVITALALWQAQCSDGGILRDQQG